MNLSSMFVWLGLGCSFSLADKQTDYHENILKMSLWLFGNRQYCLGVYGHHQAKQALFTWIGSILWYLAWLVSKRTFPDQDLSR